MSAPNTGLLSKRPKTVNLNDSMHSILKQDQSMSQTGRGLRRLMKSSISSRSATSLNDSSNLDSNRLDRFSTLIEEQNLEQQYKQLGVGTVATTDHHVTADHRGVDDGDDEDSSCVVTPLTLPTSSMNDSRRDHLLSSSPRESPTGDDVETSQKATRSVDKEKLHARLESFFSKTEAGQRFIQQNSARKSNTSSRKSPSIDRNSIDATQNYSSNDRNSIDPTNSQNEQAQDENANRRKRQSYTSHFFRTVSRDDPSPFTLIPKPQAPPLTRYNPRYSLVSYRVPDFKMDKSFNPRNRPHTTNSKRTISSSSNKSTPRLSKTQKSIQSPSTPTSTKHILSTPNTAKPPFTPLSRDLRTPHSPQLSSRKKQATPKSVGGGVGGKISAFLPPNDDDSMNSENLSPSEKKLKKWDEEVRLWADRRRPNTTNGLSSLKSKSQRDITIKSMNDLSYWPDCDVSRFDSKPCLVDMNRSTNRPSPRTTQPMLDAQYEPNHDIRYQRTTIGNHHFPRSCSRETQLYTSRVGVELASAAKSGGDLASERFAIADSAPFKFPRDPFTAKFNHIIGREDPRNNYLLDIQRQQAALSSAMPSQFDLNRVQPRTDVLLTNFKKQTGRKNNSFATSLTNLEYDIEVQERHVPGFEIGKQTSRPPLNQLQTASDEAPEFYDSRIEGTTRVTHTPNVYMGRVKGRQ